MNESDLSSKGLHAHTRGPCFGVNQETGERRWFPTRTKCKKAGFRWSELAWGGSSKVEVETASEEEAA